MRMMRANRKNAPLRELSFAGFILVAGVVFLVTWGAVWIYIAAFPMAYEDRDYPLAIAKERLIAQCRPNEVAVFGDSKVVAGVLPTAMHVPVENLAFPAATPIETYFLVSRLLRCPETPRLVVIAHSASMYPEDKFFWSLIVSSGLLNTAEIRSVEANARALGDDELEHAERSKSVPFALLPELYPMHFPPLYFGSLMGGYVVARWRYNVRALHEAMASSGRSSFGTADRSDGISDEATMADWHVSPLINLYLNRTLALLAARHVPVLIMTLPINDATCKHLPPALQQRFSAYLTEIAQTNPNVELADATIPCWPDQFYGDDMHFNLSGTLAYSRKLQSVLATLLHNDEEASKPRDQAVMAALVEARVQAPNGVGRDGEPDAADARE